MWMSIFHRRTNAPVCIHTEETPAVIWFYATLNSGLFIFFSGLPAQSRTFKDIVIVEDAVHALKL